MCVKVCARLCFKCVCMETARDRTIIRRKRKYERRRNIMTEVGIEGSSIQDWEEFNGKEIERKD